MVAYDERMTAKGPLTPKQQLDVLTLIWGENGEDGWVFLPYILKGGRDEETRHKDWNSGPAFKWPEDKNKILQWLHDREGDDLYFSANVFAGEMPRSEFMGEERILYADLDKVDPREIEEDIRPSIAWETSPGSYQAVWLLKGMVVGASESGGLNHRMTLHTKADKSGWDSVQLLRVPGRPNHKPKYRKQNGGKPVPGHLLWNRPRVVYNPEDLDDYLDPVPDRDLIEQVEDSEIEDIDRQAVWGRVRMHVAHHVREYMAMKSWQVKKGELDRSEVLWQIERELADAGCTVPEIVAIVKDTPWNKHAERRRDGGLQQLKHEASKARQEAREAGTEITLESEASSLPLDLESFVEVVKRRVPTPTWLIKQIWAKGTVGFIAGAPKSFKSYMAIDMAIAVATGLPFLNDPQFPAKRGRVLYIQEEDSESTVRQRIELITEGKSSDRHWHAQMSLEGDDASTRVKSAQDALRHAYWGPASTSSLDELYPVIRKGFMVSSPEDQGWLDEVCEKYQFDLVVIDTLGTTVGDIDTDKSAPMNQYVLKPLKAISEKHGCALAIVHHNRKPNDSGKIRSGQQMLGSVAIHAWVESALYVQSKDMIRDGLAEVKVERENKMADDMKFRVRVPHMNLGAEDNPDTLTERWEQAMQRLPWDPEVLIGWAEEQLEGVEQVREEFKKGSYTRGTKVIERMIDAEGFDETEWHTVKDIARAIGRRPSETQKQLNHARSEQLVEESDGMYRVY